MCIRAKSKKAKTLTLVFFPNMSDVLSPLHRYIAAAQRVCKKHDVLMIVDEVQTGIGRTGKV